jgi:hypothetical protein
MLYEQIGDLEGEIENLRTAKQEDEDYMRRLEAFVDKVDGVYRWMHENKFLRVEVPNSSVMDRLDGAYKALHGGGSDE